MRAAPATYADTLSSAVLRPCWEVTSWLGPQYLGEVQIVSGLLTETADEQVSGNLSLTVANEPRWRPSTPGAPLAWYGQQLRVRAGWADANQRPIVWFDLGRYRIRKPEPARDVLTVTGDSLEQLALNARFTTSTNFPASTYKGRLRALLKSVLPVKFDPALVDRAVKKQTYDRERMDAITDTLAAWPAALEILPSGVAYVSLPWEDRATTVRATYTDGPGGTVLDISPTTGEDEASNPNAVMFSSEPDDGKKVLTEAAYVRSGPRAWGGPYGYVPAFASSPLLSSRSELAKAAKTRLARLQRSVQQVVVSMVDDPRIQRGDVIRAKMAARDTDVTGRVVACQHGLTAADRGGVDMTLTVLSGKVDGVAV